MAVFEALVTVRLEVTCRVEVKAKDEEAAETKVQALIDEGRFALKWDALKPLPPALDAEWSEDSEDAEIYQIGEL